MSRLAAPNGGKDGRATIQISATPQVVEAFRAIAAEQGLDVSSFGRMVVTRVLQKNGYHPDGRPIDSDHVG